MRNQWSGDNKDDFFFDQKEKRIFIFVCRLLAATVGVCVMVLFLLAGILGAVRSVEKGVAGPLETRDAPTGQPAEEAPAGTAGTPRLTLNNFILPETSERQAEEDVPPLRERKNVWDEKDIGLFWVPPERIGLEKLREVNDKNIERLFEDIQ